MNVVSAPMADGYGKMRVCEFLPVAFVSHTDSSIDVVDYDTEIWDYHNESLESLLTIIQASRVEVGEAFSLELPNIVAQFKTITDFQDVVVPQQVVYTSDYDSTGDYDTGDDDDYEYDYEDEYDYEEN